MTEPVAHRDQPVLVYDGECRLCTAAVAWLDAHLLAPVLALPFQSPALADVGLGPAQAAATVWWIGDDGRRLQGHRAVAAGLRRCHRPWPAVAVVLDSVLVAPLAAAGYWLVSRVRHRFGRLARPETLPHLLGEPLARDAPVRPPDPLREMRRRFARRPPRRPPVVRRPRGAGEPRRRSGTPAGTHARTGTSHARGSSVHAPRGPAMAAARRTTDHDRIRRWVEERHGHPASVRETSQDGAGVLRIDFEGVGAGEEQLEPISWDEFFRKFDDSNLAFLYQDATEGGETSRFFKLVSRDGEDE